MAASPSFALLPAEIVRLVLEYSARDSSQTAARLLCVSKLVHGWIQPIFYDILIISLPTLRKRVLKRMPDLYAPWVRHICITFSADIHPSPHLSALFWHPSYLHTTDLRQDIHHALNAAIHLSHLYIDIALDHLPTFLPTSSSYSLKQTLTHLHCGSWEAWLFAGRHITFFTSLTHLRIDVVYNTGSISSFVPLLALNSLSHLAIAIDSRSGPHELQAAAKFVEAMLTREHMQLMVVRAWYCWASTSEAVRDAFRGVPAAGKVCVLGMEGSPDPVKEWEDEVRGGKSVWSRADGVLRSQSRQMCQGIILC